MKLILGLVLLFIFSANSFAEEYLPKGFCPKLISYTYYKVCYDHEHRQALWTAHWLTKESVNGKAKRKNNYRRDPNLYNPVTRNDYKGSGFDRGHLVPAADMKLNNKAMSETFYMTNMSPQRPGMNRGIWASLERFVRSMVSEKGDAYLITAPILSNEDAPFNELDSGVSIPKNYYKIAYFPKTKQMYAYLVQNKRFENYDFRDFLVPVDILEDVTGFDFYSELDDSLESELEAALP